jgi:hypothetical protein
MNETQTTDCSYCGNLLSEDELESPYTDEDNDIICDECEHEHFQFQCCKCEEYDHIDVQHYYLIVADDVDKSIPPGIYYIKGGPYFGGPLIGELGLFANKLLRLRDLPTNIDTGGYPCGHLCRTCVRKLELPTTKEYRSELAT